MPWFPSTQALRALESFSRHGTVWQAAEELNLTRSAVSHQLRILERELGFCMFNRVGKRIELTTQGVAYAEDTRHALSIISSSALRNLNDDVSGSITVSCPPGFATSWLSIKIGCFCAKFPHISISVVTPQRLDDTSNPNVDLFIAYGSGQFDLMDAELLREIEFTPLCSPELLKQAEAISSPEDVLKYNLLHLFDHSDWTKWFEKAKHSIPDFQKGIIFSDMNLVFAAALNSQGIALGDEFTCRHALACGQLVRAFELSIPAPGAYYVVCPEGRRNITAVDAFRTWVMEEYLSPESEA